MCTWSMYVSVCTCVAPECGEQRLPPLFTHSHAVCFYNCIVGHHCLAAPAPNCQTRLLGLPPSPLQYWRLLKDWAYSFLSDSQTYKETHTCTHGQRLTKTKFLPNSTAEIETWSHNKWKPFKTKDPLFWVQTYPRKTVSFLQWPKQRLFKNCSLWFWVARRNWIGVQSRLIEGLPSTTRTMKLEK